MSWHMHCLSNHCVLLHFKLNICATWAASVIIPSHSFYSDAFCGWQWKELCRQCRSCRLHQEPSPEGLYRAKKKRLTSSGPVTSHQSVCCREKGTGRYFNETVEWLLVDFLTFKLALPGLGCHFWWGNGLLTENTVLQHCTPQNGTYWTPQKK